MKTMNLLDSKKAIAHPENIAFAKERGALINEVGYKDFYHNILSLSGKHSPAIKVEIAEHAGADRHWLERKT
jgi:hypothetical protein